MIVLDGNSLTLQDFIKIVRYDEKVALAESAKEAIVRSREVVEKLIKTEEVAYGITTGFGKLSDVIIEEKDLSKLQEKLLNSHAVGVGKPFNKETARGIMVLRVNALAKGVSGIRLEVVEHLIKYINEGVIPYIPEKGSLGASGDLAPLAHMAITLLGKGHVLHRGKKVETKEYLKEVGINPLPNLEAKDGLSLINGTQAMTSVGAIAIYDAINLAKISDISGSLSLEALTGIVDAFDKNIHEVRPHHGQISTAVNILNLVEDSSMVTRQGELRTQDAYSLRCISQVHGATKDAIDYAIEKIEIEMNSATDNPLIFGDYVVSAGNFHGQPMAITFDFLKIAVAEIASISERRIERLVNSCLSNGLPPFLVKNPGLNSGFMILQYSAASLVSENKVLAHPASVDSIPSSANQEDHVSMGTIAARGLRDILDNSRKVVAMELMSAAQAIDFRGNEMLGVGTNAAFKLIRERLPFIVEDELMYTFIDEVEDLIKSNELLEKVEEVVGELRI